MLNCDIFPVIVVVKSFLELFIDLHTLKTLTNKLYETVDNYIKCKENFLIETKIAKTINFSFEHKPSSQQQTAHYNFYE